MQARVIQGLFPGGRPAVRPLTAIQLHGGAGDLAVDPALLRTTGPGARLPEAVRARMEAALGADFSDVRVHVGPQAQSIGAIAFTTGTDLYFAPGRFQPETAEGRRLLGHELAHVVQQRQGRVRGDAGRVTVVQDAVLEAEAERAGVRAASAIGPLAMPTAGNHGPPGSEALVQRRAYGKATIDGFLRDNRRGPGEVMGTYVGRVTRAFREQHGYAQRDDLAALRTGAWGVGDAMPPYPTVLTFALAHDFDDHVLGKVVGVGWHLETTHRNGDQDNGNPREVTHSYTGRTVLSSRKGTYKASNLMIRKTRKSGNNGVGTFFSATTSIEQVRHDALYVANAYPRSGQLVIGRGQRTGVLIECILRDGQVESAYPHLADRT